MDRLSILMEARMCSKKTVAIVGCGIFGAVTALRLSELGMDVNVFESNDRALSGASYNNQNRLHLGFHYPRDKETAKQCIRGFDNFRKEFSESILADFQNMYFIASEKSLVSPDEYLAFCDSVGLSYNILETSMINPKIQNVDLGISCDEVVYDCEILRKLVINRLDDSNVSLNLNSKVTDIKHADNGYAVTINNNQKKYFDAVINCSYADANRLTEKLGHNIQKRQYEYTVVPIIKWDFPPVGITIMDGPFMTVLPFGKTGDFLLYHVNHSVIEKIVESNMPSSWTNSEDSPSKNLNALFEKTREECSYFIPELINSSCVGFLQGPRVVVANRDKDDSRRSMVEQLETGYITVFAGKIDHCTWVADEVASLLNY
jgi:hypothetical protein